MKTLYLSRHAKSSWDFEELTDHDRPLNKRGRKDAPRMGQALKEKGIKPDLMISSPAVRALTTATILAKEMGYEQDEIQVIDEIYGADKTELLDIIREAPNEANSLMLTGHNDALTDLGNYLSPKDIANIPTSGVLALEFDIDSWKLAGPENCRFAFFEFPKNLDLSK